jgi:hypothetical protein
MGIFLTVHRRNLQTSALQYFMIFSASSVDLVFWEFGDFLDAKRSTRCRMESIQQFWDSLDTLINYRFQGAFPGKLGVGLSP